MPALVRIRPLALSDLDNVMTWVNDPDIVGNFAAFSGKPFTREDEAAYLAKLLASPNDRVFSIERAADGAYLGQVGIHQIHWPSRVGRLACIVGSRAEMGKGHGTAAIGAVLDRAFGEAALHKVWLMVAKSNARARAIYARIGFVEEGVLREEYFLRAAWHDMVRMSLLDREWRALREKT
ncbi:GNAT family N-acetyltransferase [bacterium]|nr:GNAT family N-acetyltransferase [bacterium]